MFEPKTVHLGVMALERRCVPAVYVVTNTSDTDPGSLRQAIASANFNPGPDVLQFSGLFDSPQTIKLTSGALAINGPLTITGPGSSYLTVDANKNGRAFNIQPGDSVTVSFSGFTVANGLVATGTVGGGAMSFRANGSTLALDDCAVFNSKANFLPGGAFLLRPTVTTGAKNTLTIQDCAFTENHNGGGNTSGGAISALKCDVSVAKSSFTQNLGGRGAAIGVFDSTLAIEMSTFTVNTAPAGGGAIDF